MRYSGIALGVSSDTLKDIVRHHLPQQYKFSWKEINIDDSMMTLNYSLQYLGPAGSYEVHRT